MVSAWSVFSVGVASGGGAESALGLVGATFAAGDGVLAGLASDLAPDLAPDFGVETVSILWGGAGVGFGLAGMADLGDKVDAGAFLGVGVPSCLLAASGFLAGFCGAAGGLVAGAAS